MLVWFHTLFSTRPPFVTSICFSAFFKRMKNWDIFFPSIKEFFAVIAFDSIRFVSYSARRIKFFFSCCRGRSRCIVAKFFNPPNFSSHAAPKTWASFSWLLSRSVRVFFFSLSRAQEWDWLNVERGRVRRRVQVLYVSEKGSLVTVGGGEGGSAVALHGKRERFEEQSIACISRRDPSALRMSHSTLTLSLSLSSSSPTLYLPSPPPPRAAAALTILWFTSCSQSSLFQFFYYRGRLSLWKARMPSPTNFFTRMREGGEGVWGKKKWGEIERRCLHKRQKM